MKPKKLSPISYQLTIGWLYPELMSTYGDRGNIIALTKRCEWRGIKAKINRISLSTVNRELITSDLLFMGGAQDTQQEIVNKDLFEKKCDTLKKMIEENVPGLFICGAYQFLGKHYKTAEGKILPGLGIFPCFTENPGENKQRLIGNIIVRVHGSQFIVHSNTMNDEQITNKQSLRAEDLNQIVGFENHGGRTYLENKSMAFGTVEKGYGNNGSDKTEGIVYKNSIGSYLHGPILPKNPELADWLIQKALEKKYGKEIKLEPLDDSLEEQAKQSVISHI